MWQGTVLLIATLLFAIGHAAFGMLMGLYFPKLDAVNETVVIKQSMATVLAMFASIAILGAAAGLYYWGGRIIWWMALALPVGLFALFAAVCALILKKQGPSMLKRL